MPDPTTDEAIYQILAQTAATLEERLAAIGEMGSFAIVAQLPKSDQAAQIIRLNPVSGSPLTLVGALDRARLRIHQALEASEAERIREEAASFDFAQELESQGPPDGQGLN